MAPTKSLVVVRGDRRAEKLDSTFACVSHANQRQSYVALELENGKVAGRTVYDRSKRSDLEKRMSDPSYNTILVDERADRNLLPLSAPKGAIAADLSEMRRAKSDVEIRRLRQMEARVRKGMASDGDDSFRGVVAKNGVAPAFTRRESKGNFVEYRGGAKHPSGLTVELSRVVPESNAWASRLDRAEAGFRAVEAMM